MFQFSAEFASKNDCFCSSYACFRGSIGNIRPLDHRTDKNISCIVHVLVLAKKKPHGLFNGLVRYFVVFMFW